MYRKTELEPGGAGLGAPAALASPLHLIPKEIKGAPRRFVPSPAVSVGVVAAVVPGKNQ